MTQTIQLLWLLDNWICLRGTIFLVRIHGMSLADRLSSARRSKGLTQAALAQLVGVSQQNIAQLETGKVDRSGRLLEIAAALGVRAEWLKFGIEPMHEPAGLPVVVPDDQYHDVIGYSQAAGLGDGAEAEEYAETHSLKFKANSLRRKGLQARNLAIYYGKGDSMEPTIKDGDAILFDTSDTRVVDGAMYVIRIDGAANAEFYVKRALVLDAGVYFFSDNPTGDHGWRKPRPMDSKRQPITVIGRVHWIGSWAA